MQEGKKIKIKIKIRTQVHKRQLLDKVRKEEKLRWVGKQSRKKKKSGV